MFFILSKLISAFLKPVVWFVLLLAWAFLTKNEKKRRQILRGCFWLFFFLTNPLFSNFVFKSWEARPVPMTSLRDTFDVGIVLGGYSSFNSEMFDDRLNLNIAGNRLIDAVVLYKKGLIKKILITGGDGELLGKNVSEADMTLPFLKTLGIPDSDIILESKSRNTRENAVFTKVVLEKMGLGQARCLLITSAFHVPRASAIFKKVGLDFTAFPAHFFSERFEWKASATILPDRMGLYKWELFIKEWIGYAVYWTQGYL